MFYASRDTGTPEDTRDTVRHGTTQSVDESVRRSAEGQLTCPPD